MATRYARGVGAHSGGLREVLNPWGKIAGSLSRQCGGAVGGAAWQKGAAVCLGTAQTRASTGSPVGIPRPRCPPSPPPGRRAQAGEGCLPSQAKHAVGALRARCGVCGVCVGSPWGPVGGRRGLWGARGASEGAGEGARPREAELSRSRLAVSPPPRAGDRHGHLSREQRGSAGRGPSRHFRAGRRWSGSGAARTPGGGGTTAPGPERAGPDRTPPPSAGPPGGTMITSAGEGAARSSVARRGFAESGP